MDMRGPGRRSSTPGSSGPPGRWPRRRSGVRPTRRRPGRGTAERDYNHSTWLDILIPEILGLVPRDDDILEIDPLLPPDALSSFLLDGQHYRGHDVTIVWDAPGGADRYGDGRKGLDVYLDGK